MEIDLGESLTDKQKAAILVILGNLANVDGDFDDSEEAIMNACNSTLKFDISSGRGLELFTAVQNMNFDELIQIIKPLSRLQHELIIIWAVELIAADGVFHENEINAIGNLCMCLGISPKDFKKIQSNYLKTTKKYSNKKSGCFSTSFIIFALIIVLIILINSFIDNSL